MTHACIVKFVKFPKLPLPISLHSLLYLIKLHSLHLIKPDLDS